VRFTHREHPGRCVRLAYCLNVHPAETFEELVEGLKSITLPLRDRIARPGEPFGVGMYLAAAAAHELERSRSALELLRKLLEREGLDPFTYNAFPYGGFHTGRVKQKVYAPVWGEPARLQYTLTVAELARELIAPRRRVSISTHSGGWGADMERPGAVERAGQALASFAARCPSDTVLGIEAEPRSNANGTAAAVAIAALAGVGLCLDACHSAVEFEEPIAALDAALSVAPLAKLQYTNALALKDPARNRAGWQALLAMDEPRYLHQVTACTAQGLRRWDDLDALRDVDPGPLEEVRCHFHVPVDREELGAGLRTTRGHAEQLLDLLLDAPARWKSEELHVEIETYTWDVLPGAARGPGSLVEGLEREYRHVIGRLEARGWSRAG